MKVVIDSSILIDYFRGGKEWQEFLETTPKEVELFLPTVIFFELFSGKSSKDTLIGKSILQLLRQFTSVELTESIAKRAGELYRDTTGRIDAVDYIIAATALEIGGSVLTLNKKHFQQISNLQIYSLD